MLLILVCFQFISSLMSPQSLIPYPANTSWIDLLPLGLGVLFTMYIFRITGQKALVHHGVPQGSVLGPLLFIMYLLPLGNIFCCYGIYLHCYADDIQVSLTTKLTFTLPWPYCLSAWFMYRDDNKPILLKLLVSSLPIAKATITVSTQALSPLHKCHNITSRVQFLRSIF